jgi:hypothetical protein
VRGRDRVDVIECTWDSAALDPKALAVFRGHYPAGRNYLVSPSGSPAHTRRVGSHDVLVCTPSELLP